MRAQKLRREFQREEAMEAVRAPGRPQPRTLQGVDRQLPGADAALDIPVLQGAGAGEIQAHLQAAGMERTSPVHVAREVEIVPLDAQAAFGEAAVQPPPSPVDGRPGSLLGLGLVLLGCAVR